MTAGETPALQASRGFHRVLGGGGFARMGQTQAAEAGEMD